MTSNVLAPFASGCELAKKETERAAAEAERFSPLRVGVRARPLDEALERNVELRFSPLRVGVRARLGRKKVVPYIRKSFSPLRVGVRARQKVKYV